MNKLSTGKNNNIQLFTQKSYNADTEICYKLDGI